MKILSIIAAVFSFCILNAADFSVEVTKITETAAPGKPIEMEVTLACPDGYRPAAWVLTAFRNGVPAEFPAALNLESKFSKSKNPQWSYCNIFTKWFRKSDNSLQKKLVITTTDKWPEGDYKFTVQIIFRKSGAKDKYMSKIILFTLEKPAETEAETPKAEEKAGDAA